MSLMTPNSPHRIDGLITPARPNTSGWVISPYRLIRPPIDEPMMPVASGSARVGNVRSTSGLTDPTSHSR